MDVLIAQEDLNFAFERSGSLATDIGDDFLTPNGNGARRRRETGPDGQPSSFDKYVDGARGAGAPLAETPSVITATAQRAKVALDTLKAKVPTVIDLTVVEGPGNLTVDVIDLLIGDAMADNEKAYARLSSTMGT